MSRPQQLAALFALTWVRLYTSRLSRDARTTRLKEIESDLWEHVSDREEAGARPLGTALEIVLRTCRGVVDDLSWSVEVGLLGQAEPIGGRSVVDSRARRTRWVAIFMVAFGAMGILLFGIVPTLSAYFASVDIPLPTPTRAVMGMSAFLTAYWWVGAIMAVALLLGVTRLSEVGAAEGDVTTDAIVAKLEPVVIVGLCLLVGLMTVAMFLPIFDVVAATK